MSSETPSTFEDAFQKLMSPETIEWKTFSDFFKTETVDTTRARSKCRKSANSGKMQSRRSQSIKSSKEKKILNIDVQSDVFFNVSSAFEDALNQLQIDDGSYQQVLEKLIQIDNLLKNKICSLKMKNLKKDRSRKKHSELKNLEYSQSLASSEQNMGSESSSSETYLRDDSSFKEFLINVNCPFCLKTQDDKVNLIKHIDESCKAQMQKKFEKKDHIPFSTFQILPNNAVKCNVCPNSIQHNLKHYFDHFQSNQHITAYNNACKSKYYSDLLFCSCCKIQVLNTFSQIDFHINHEVHKIKSGTVPKSENFLKKGIHCVYFKIKKFRCFDCPSQSFYQTPKEILQHFEDPKHLKNVKKNIPNLSVVYCEFCSKEVHIYEIINHFTSNEHKDKEQDEVLDGIFELCFYCGFMCENLMELSLHMKSNCNEIKCLRKQNLKSNRLAKKDLKNTEKKYRKKMEQNRSNEEGFIIVKDYTEISELYKYFIKFGEITAVEKIDDNNIIIKFQEKDAVRDILLLQNMHKINEVKIDIETELFNFPEKNKKLKEGKRRKKPTLNENVESHSSYSSTETEEDGNLTFDTKLKSDQLEILFKRVSSHLKNVTLKLDSATEKKITSDCAEILQMKCDLVGFSGCGLSFPVETISLYCESETNLCTMIIENFMNDDKDVNKNLIKHLCTKMFESNFWEEVIICFEGPFFQLKCKHRATQKPCTVTFSKSTMILTNLLRDIMKKNELIRSFCLVIRFWLSVHELKIKKFEYGIISLLIFFFTSEKIVEFSMNFEYVNLDVLLFHKIIQDKLNFDMNSSTGAGFNIITFTQLFHRFFMFLSAFDFDNFCICLPLPCPLEKSFLSQSLNVSSNFEKILKSPMCIIDPLLLVNLTSDISRKDVKSLKKAADSAIKKIDCSIIT